MAYLSGVLAILDATIKEMMQVPIFATFLGGLLMLAVLGVVLSLKGACGGNSRR